MSDGTAFSNLNFFVKNRQNFFAIELLDWCALGSATGGKHVSAISHSRVHPVDNHKRSNCDRSLKESVP